MLLFRGGTLCILDFDWIYSKHNLFLSSIKFFFFLFCKFDNARDAEDAIKGRDGYNFDGCRLRVIRSPISFIGVLCFLIS